MKHSDGMRLYGAERIVKIAVRDIRTDGRRQQGDPERQDIRGLTASVARYGVLQPLSVRRAGGRYELISGRRRLLAAQAAGLEEVPCVVLDVAAPETEIIALTENLQRKELDFVEEAAALRRLVELHGLSRREAARLTGLSVAALNNKLRLLRMPRELLRAVHLSGLTERHARALLRLKTDGEMAAALEHILKNGLTVAQSEEYIDALLTKGAETKAPCKEARPERRLLLGDVRLFLNTVARGAELMRAAGVDAELGRTDTEDEIRLEIRIPRK